MPSSPTKRHTFARFFHASIRLMAFWALFFKVIQVDAQCGVPITTFPYHEDFETSQGGWVSGGVGNDWAWGAPAKPTINSAGSGMNCWVVGGLTGSFYSLAERSFVESPCFDFTLLPHPYIHFKIWWESEQRFDGANLQYSTDGGASWTNVGAINDPIDCLNDNWYNFSPITNLSTIANPRHGWSGNIKPTVGSCQGGFGSNGWVIAKHCMPYLAGNPSVKFRFVFGAGTTCNDFDGVAFDDLYIENAPPIGANFSSACSGNNTYAFTDLSTNCPDTWNWNFGDPASGASNLSTSQNPFHTFSGPGTYMVSLQASSSCSGASSITFPVTILGLSTSSTMPACNGGTDGTATVQINPAGGNPSYIWSTIPAQNGATANDLAAGTYTVTVSETGVCPATATVVISEPAVLQHTVNIQAAQCGSSNGSATILSSGGTGAYSYSWAPNVSNTNSASNLAPGNYIVSILDQNNCPDSVYINIPNLPGVTASIVQIINVGCFGGNDGAISINSNAGTPPYTYSWSPTGGNGPTASGLTAGTYTLTVTDANLCSATLIAMVTQTPALQHSTLIIPANCGGMNGSATITSIGGTGNYTYQWLPNVSNASSANNLSAGNYIVSVTDQNSCLDTVHIDVTNVSGINGTINQIANVSCFGGNDGMISVTAASGTPPYTYAWSPLGGNGPSASGLPAGTYTVLITDANLCITNITATLGQASALQPTSTITDASCAGADGSAMITQSGGTSPYTYIWSPAVATGSQATGLIPGDYSVTIQDSKGCLDSLQITVNLTPGVQAQSLDLIPPACNLGQDGSISVSATGGNAPYSYLWLPQGGNGPTASSLPAGTYQVIVTDALGCADTLSGTLQAPAPMMVSAKASPVRCPGNSDGVIQVETVIGGTAPYVYGLESTTLGTSTLLSGLQAGVYVVQVQDAVGCISLDTVQVDTPLANGLQVLGDTTISLGNSVFLSGLVSLPGQVQSYTWTPALYLECDTCLSTLATPALTTTYTLTATDTNGCIISDALIIRVLGASVYIPNVIKPASNDLNDYFTVFAGQGVELVELLQIYDRWGSLVFENQNFLASEPRFGWDGTIKGRDAAIGVYVYVIKVRYINGLSVHYKGDLTVVR